MALKVNVIITGEQNEQVPRAGGFLCSESREVVKSAAGLHHQPERGAASL